MSQVRSILVAVDRFPPGNAALARAAELARTHGARLTIVHIAEEFGAWSARGLAAAERHLVETQAQASARERIEDAVRTLDLGRIPVDIRVEPGSPSSRVVEISDELGADLVVLTAHQRRSVRERLIGSTADRITRATASSVLIVRRPVERAYRNIIVAVDFSDVSEATAALSAEMCPGAGLRLVHVVQVPMQFEQAMLRTGTGRAAMAAFQRALVDQAKERLRGLAKQFVGREDLPGFGLSKATPRNPWSAQRGARVWT